MHPEGTSACAQLPVRYPSSNSRRPGCEPGSEAGRLTIDDLQDCVQRKRAA